LIFSETRNWRHEEGIAGATLAIMKAAKEMGHGYFSTEHSGIFNDKDLARYDVVVFNNMTGDSLTPEEEAAFARWQSKGNGTVLIHGAGDASHQDWDFYHNQLLGTTFVSHPADPQFQEARVEVLAPAHPVMAGVPSDFMAIDEWYTFEAPPGDDFVILAGLDESTYSPVNNVYGDVSDLRMGPTPADHPIIWARCFGDSQARSVFTAMGHRYETYETKEAVLLLKNMLNWVAKKSDPQSSGCAK
jgi:type 1 glutamine amidotransferase